MTEPMAHPDFSPVKDRQQGLHSLKEQAKRLAGKDEEGKFHLSDGRILYIDVRKAALFRKEKITIKLRGEQPDGVTSFEEITLKQKRNAQEVTTHYSTGRSQGKTRIVDRAPQFDDEKIEELNSLLASVTPESRIKNDRREAVKTLVQVAGGAVLTAAALPALEKVMTYFPINASPDAGGQSPYNPEEQKRIAEIAKIFDQPTKMPDTNGMNGNEAHQIELTHKRETMTRLGLTPPPYPDRYEELRTDAIEHSDHQTIPLEEYIGVVQTFLQTNYGVELIIPKPQTDTLAVYPGGGMPLDQETLNTNKEIRESLVSLISTFAEFAPTQFIKATGLKKIYLVSIPDHDETRISGTAGIPDSYFLDPTKWNSDTIIHEIGHLMDNKFGDMFDDPKYSNYNPKDIYTNDMSEAIKKRDGEYVSDEYLELLVIFDKFRPLQEAKEKGLPPDEELQREYDDLASRVAVVKSYSFMNIAEDKATVFADIFFGRLDSLLDPKKPILRQKTLFFLSRLKDDFDQEKEGLGLKMMQYLADTRKVLYRP